MSNSVSFARALLFWLKLGCISFGGPAGQIALMHTELVERRRWISNTRFIHALNYCMLLPGPEAQQLATYVGWLMHGTRGAFAAGLLFIAPSLLLLIALSWVYMALGHHPMVAGVLWAIKPAVTALVAHAAWRIGKRTLHGPLLMALALCSGVAVYFFDTPFPLIVLCAAALGWVGARFVPAQFHAAHPALPTSTSTRALIDDDSPAHTAPSRAGFARVVVWSLLLWFMPMVALATLTEWHGTLTQVGWFFSKAALLTFGGAYAVLPYVVQGAVEHYGWLTLNQMIDGLGLGESTPGPLIMIVTFVGFVTGWQTQTLAAWGIGSLMLSAVVAACVATYFTFLPSFAFILAGAPFVESTRHMPQIAAPLQAITAAVVGVIAQLALYFATHVFWPQGASGVDGAAVVLALAAWIALVRFNLNVLTLICLCVVLGLLRGWIL